jgi:hypothetical protein
MDNWFVPSRRLRDRISFGDEIFYSYLGTNFDEIELTEHGLHILLSGGCAWRAFAFKVGNRIVWISRNSFLDISFHLNSGDILHFDYVLGIEFRSSNDDLHKIEVWASSSAQASFAYEIVFQLLSTNEVSEMTIVTGAQGRIFPVQTPVLAQFIDRRNENSLRALKIDGFELDDNLLHALWAVNIIDTEVVLLHCSIGQSGAVLQESLQRNRGPTSLIDNRIDNAVLGNSLRGNTSINTLYLNGPQVSQQEMPVLIQDLARSLRLKELSFGGQMLCDEHWALACQSFANHPTLQILDLSGTSSRPYIVVEGIDTMDETRKTKRTSALAEMLKTNTILSTIRLTIEEYDSQIWEDEIKPHLLVNQYRPRARAIRAIQDDAWRAKLLGLALSSVSGNPTLVYILFTKHLESAARWG